MLLPVLIVVVIGLVAIFFLDVGKQTPPTDTSRTVDTKVSELKNQSTSDEVGAIEKDVSATKLDDLDGEMTEVDNSLKSL